jgi:Collagen triple helix repeat (20 copies)/Divergent InlB B-repeat domain
MTPTSTQSKRKEALMRRFFAGHPTGPGLYLFAALAAAFLLVPAAQALAETGVAAYHIHGAGEGSGWIKGNAPATEGGGTPQVHCHWNGATKELTETCDGIVDNIGIEGIVVIAEADPGSEFIGWKVTSGIVFGGCKEKAASESEECAAITVSPAVPVEVTATFECEGTPPCPPPSGPSLAIDTETGTGSGQVSCEVNGTETDVPCEEEYEAGDELKLIPEADEGSEFANFENASGETAEADCAGTPTTCEFTIEEDTSIDAVFTLETRELTLSESGPGELIVECGASPCSGTELEEIDYGTEVTVTAEPDIGAKTTLFEGTNSAAGCEEPADSPCTFSLTEDSALSAEFAAIPPQPLTIEVEGNGEVTGTGIACTEAGNGTAACEEEFPEGEEVPLAASANPGNHFVEWETLEGGEEGTCTGAAAPCKTAALSESVKLKAKFAVTTTSPLSVFVTGEGEVSADSGPISGCTEAGGAECEGLYEGTVVLSESHPSGYVFAGWIGCKHKSATECEVTVDEEKDVYAVFLTEGTEGAEGQPGETPEITTVAPGGECGQASGIKVTLGAFEEVICNGANGTDGTNGANGADGKDGAPGAAGPQGPKGDSGATGPQGPQGPQGKQGPAGKVKVTCKAKGKKVVCKVKYAKSNKRHGKRYRLRWRLMQGGHAVGHGATGAAGLQRTLNRAPSGRYVLRIAGQKGGKRISIR